MEPDAWGAVFGRPAGGCSWSIVWQRRDMLSHKSESVRVFVGCGGCKDAGISLTIVSGSARMVRGCGEGAAHDSGRHSAAIRGAWRRLGSQEWQAGVYDGGVVAIGGGAACRQGYERVKGQAVARRGGSRPDAMPTKSRPPAVRIMNKGLGVPVDSDAWGVLAVLSSCG